MIGPILSGVARLVFSSSGVNIVCHGDSLTYGQSGATFPYPEQLQQLPPINGQVVCRNLGQNGQQWDQMMSSGSGAAADSFYDPSKANILIAWEDTNAVNIGGFNAVQTDQKRAAYFAERLAVHPNWMIIGMTTLPIYYQGWSDATAASINAIQNDVSDRLRANWRSMGLKGLVDVQQAGSVFRLPNYLKTTFQAANVDGQSIWSPNDQFGGGGSGQNQWVHPSNIGYTQIAKMVAAVLKRLPKR